MGGVLLNNSSSRLVHRASTKLSDIGVPERHSQQIPPAAAVRRRPHTPHRQRNEGAFVARVHQMQLAKIDGVERVSKMAPPISKRFISKL